MCDGAVLGEGSVVGEVGGRAVMKPRLIAVTSHAERGPHHNPSQSKSDVLSIFAGWAASIFAVMLRELVMLVAAVTKGGVRAHVPIPAECTGGACCAAP